MIKRLILLTAYFAMCGFGGVYLGTNSIDTVLQGDQFKPTDISGLALWLDASDTSTLWDSPVGGSLSVNGGAVGRWEDKSGNNNHATNGVIADMPKRSDNARNGKTGILFDTTDFYHMYKTASIGTLSTVFIVQNSKSRANYAPLVAIPGAGTYLVSAESGGSGTTINANVGTPLMYWSGILQGVVTRNMVYLNGLNKAVIYSLTSVNFTAWPSIYISGWGAYFNYSGDMYDILIYNRVLTTSERQQVEKYLSAKWAINLNNITNPSSTIDNILKMQTPVGAVYQGTNRVYRFKNRNYPKTVQ